VSPDQERLAVAWAVERWQGPRAPVFAAERIGALAIAGDVDGVARWTAIAAKLKPLLAARLSS